jgi:rod shape-determining protein MreD
MRVAGVVVVTALALALQTTLTQFVPATGALDLVLIAVVFAALANGPTTGLIAGTCGGLLQDALSSGVIGIGGLAKTIVGFVTGIAGAQFILTQSAPRFVVFFGASVLHATVFIGTYELLGLRDFGAPLGAIALQAVANATVGVLAFKVVEVLPGALERRRLQGSRLRRR